MSSKLAAEALLACCVVLVACGQQVSLVDDAGPDATDVDAAEVPDAAEPETRDSGPVCRHGETPCGGECVDTAIDGRHCGTCGTTCGSGLGCFGAECTTPARLSTARVAFGATLGPDGLIYAIAGVDARGEIIATVEVYDARTNLWTEVAPRPAPRAIVGAAYGTDGRIYSVGGIDASYAPTAGVDALDLLEGVWTEAVAAPTATVQFGLAVTPDGRICRIGGTDRFGPVATADGYDVEVARWSTLSDLPMARQGLSAVTSRDGRLWAVGGGVPEGMEAHATNAVEVYDPQGDVWASGPAMAEPRFEPAAVALGEGILVTGGHGEGHETLESTEILEGDAWIEGPPMSEPRAAHAAVLGEDGRVFVFGGHGAEDWDVLDTMEVYDPSTDAWVPR